MLKLLDSQLNKLKSSVKNQTSVALKMNITISNGNNLPHELFLTTRQRNVFENNMLIDIKLSRAQIFKVIQSGGFLGSLLSKLADQLMKVAVPVAINILVPSEMTGSASAIDAEIQKK